MWPSVTETFPLTQPSGRRTPCLILPHWPRVLAVIVREGLEKRSVDGNIWRVFFNSGVGMTKGLLKIA